MNGIGLDTGAMNSTASPMPRAAACSWSACFNGPDPVSRRRTGRDRRAIATARSRLSKFFCGASLPTARTSGCSPTSDSHRCETGSAARLRTASASTPLGMTTALRIAPLPNTASLRSRCGETNTSRSANAATVRNFNTLHQRENGLTGLPSIMWSRSLLIRTMVRQPDKPRDAITLARCPWLPAENNTSGANALS